MADQRALVADLGGGAALRPVLRGELDAGHGPGDPAQDGRGRPAPGGLRLIGILFLKVMIILARLI